MEWIQLNSMDLLDELLQASYKSPQIIFKHSTRCSISHMVLNRLGKNLPKADYYLLNVIGDREISNFVANHFNITHQSPQLLMIYKGACIFNASHFSISRELVKQEIDALQPI